MDIPDKKDSDLELKPADPSVSPWTDAVRKHWGYDFNSGKPGQDNNSQTRPPAGWTPDRENHPGGWGVGRFEDKVKDLPAPPRPGDPPITARPLFLGQPRTVLTHPLSEEEIRESVLFNTDGRWLLAAGGATGGVMGIGTWAMDRYTGSIPPEMRTGLAATWRQRFSPSERMVPGLETELSRIRTAVDEANASYQLAQDRFNRAEAARANAAGRVQGAIPAQPLSAADRAFFERRIDLIRSEARFNRAEIMANAGTEAQVRLRSRLYTLAEAELLAQNADEYWRTLGQRDSSLATYRTAQRTSNEVANRLTAARTGSVHSLPEAGVRGVGQGIGIAALTVGTDMVLDKMLGNSPELKSMGSWGLQGIGLPVLLMSRAPGWAKLAGSLSLVGTSHLMDRQLGPPTGMFSVFSRPSLPEVALTTAAALSPIPDRRVKAGLVAGSWLLGRGYNLLNDRYDFEGKPQSKLEREAQGYTSIYMQKADQDSLTGALEKIARLARENEGAASLLVGDFQRHHRELPAPELLRGRAVCLIGIGLSKLELGTRTDREEYDRKHRIGAGTNYDLGGDAASYLRHARASLESAREHALALKDQTVGGRKIDDSYLEHLDSLHKMVSAKLDVIYGSHPKLDAVLQEVEDRARANPEEMRRYGQALADLLGKMTDKDSRFKGKLCRDLALLHIGMARATRDESYKSDHYYFAKRYLEEAAPLDPAAEDDLRKLREWLVK